MDIIKDNKSECMIDLYILANTLESTFFSSFVAKLIGSIGIIILSQYMPIEGFLHFTVLLLIFDFLLGICAKKFPKDKNILYSPQENAGRRSVLKGVIYSFLIFGFHKASQVYSLNFELSYAASVFITYTEAFEIDVKWKVFTGKSIIDYFKDKFTSVFSRVTKI